VSDDKNACNSSCTNYGFVSVGNTCVACAA